MDARLDTVQEMFSRMHGDGLDTSAPLQWGYFFVNDAPALLEELAVQFEEFGYRKESLHQSDDGAWVLQLSKVETHTAESLHARNEKFNALVDDWGIDLYDGWDVGRPSA
jgi:Regulator of ribonuclease activity B